MYICIYTYTYIHTYAAVEDRKEGRVYPQVNSIREVSLNVACAVATVAIQRALYAIKGALHSIMRAKQNARKTGSRKTLAQTLVMRQRSLHLNPTFN